MHTKQIESTRTAHTPGQHPSPLALSHAELLAALIGVIALLDDFYCYGEMAHSEGIIARARAAIAKATT